LLDKVHDHSERDYYAAAAVQQGWSRNVLLNQIMNQLHRRAGAAPSNFPAELPGADSELAQQLTRDPYVLDFLDLTQPAAERDLENALVARLQAFLLELGHGFAFVGRQYHFQVDGDDFYLDLLFFNWAQSRFVVIELKSAASSPSTPASSGSTSPGSRTTCVTSTATPHHRYRRFAPAATTTSCGTASPTPPHPLPSPTTPTKPARPRTRRRPHRPPAHRPRQPRPDTTRQPDHLISVPFTATAAVVR